MIKHLLRAGIIFVIFLFFLFTFPEKLYLTISSGLVCMGHLFLASIDCPP